MFTSNLRLCCSKLECFQRQFVSLTSKPETVQVEPLSRTLFSEQANGLLPKIVYGTARRFYDIGPKMSTTGRSPRTGAGTIKHYIFILEQAALNKSNLLLTIILQNPQTLQLFTKIINTDSIYKSY